MKTEAHETKNDHSEAAEIKTLKQLQAQVAISKAQSCQTYQQESSWAASFWRTNSQQPLSVVLFPLQRGQTSCS